MNRMRQVVMCIILFVAGYLCNSLFDVIKAEAQRPANKTYKVVRVADPYNNDAFAANLTEAAKGGWKFVLITASGGNYATVIFEK